MAELGCQTILTLQVWQSANRDQLLTRCRVLMTERLLNGGVIAESIDYSEPEFINAYIDQYGPHPAHWEMNASGFTE